MDCPWTNTTNFFCAGSSHNRSGTKYHTDTSIHKFSLFPTKLSGRGQWGLFPLVSLSGGGPPGRHPPAGGYPTTGLLHKGEALQSQDCLSQRQHSLSDLPSAALYQASLALLNASHHNGCVWIDARVSLARATLGILDKRKKHSVAHLQTLQFSQIVQMNFFFLIYIHIFFHDVRKSSATTESITLLQRKLCGISVGSPIPPKAKRKCYFLPRHPHSFCFITTLSIKGPWLELWPIVWWTRNPHFL